MYQEFLLFSAINLCLVPTFVDLLMTMLKTRIGAVKFMKWLLINFYL
jgi:hypothetical protein